MAKQGRRARGRPNENVSVDAVGDIPLGTERGINVCSVFAKAPASARNRPGTDLCGERDLAGYRHLRDRTRYLDIITSQYPGCGFEL